MNDPLIQVEQVSKSFALAQTNRQRLSAIWHLLRQQADDDAVEVIRNISLTVKRGQSIALIGPNGAGKSTLLKLICGVLTPSNGAVSINATIGPMLELGAGFNPEFTGRENLRLAAALAGIGTNELRAKEPRIVQFADIGRYIDEPVKHYSSGMVVRLGFALLTETKPDVLITDEVLGVGDESFQRKCQHWLDGYIANGGTLLLVSHGMDVVRRLCSEAIWLHDGQIRLQGNPKDVTAAYLTWQDQQYEAQQQIDTPIDGTRHQLLRLRANDQDEQLHLARGSDLTLRLDLFSPDDRAPVVAVGLKDRFGTPIYGTTSEIDGVTGRRTAPHRFQFVLTFPQLPLRAGRYRINGHAMDPEGLRLFDTLTCELTIEGDSEEIGPLDLRVSKSL